MPSPSISYSIGKTSVLSSEVFPMPTTLRENNVIKSKYPAVVSQLGVEKQVDLVAAAPHVEQAGAPGAK